jgi:hypothetical protein
MQTMTTATPLRLPKETAHLKMTGNSMKKAILIRSSVTNFL